MGTCPVITLLHLGVQMDRILSDRTNIRYLNIRTDTDTDIISNFNYPYPNSRYILYNLIYIMKKLMLFIIIKCGYPYRIMLISDPYSYPSNIQSVSGK